MGRDSPLELSPGKRDVCWRRPSVAQRQCLYFSLVIVVDPLCVLAWMALRPRGDADPFPARLSRALGGLTILVTF